MASKLSGSLHNTKNFSINQEEFANQPNPMIGKNQNAYHSASSLHPTSNCFDDMQDGNTVSAKSDSKITSDVNLINYKVDQSLEMNRKMREEIETTKEKEAGFNSETKIMLLSINNLSNKVDKVDQRIDKEAKISKERFDKVDQRFDKEAKISKERFDKVDQRFDKVDQRFDKVDQRFDKVDQRFDKVDQRISDVDGRIHSLNLCLIGGFFLVICSSIFRRPFQKSFFRKKRIRNIPKNGT